MPLSIRNALGGWCRVYHELNNKETETFKEVSLQEYQKFKDGKPMANWGSKPCTMIEKVAVSQAVRAAFPDDYQGLYTAEEFGTQIGMQRKDRFLIPAQQDQPELYVTRWFTSPGTEAGVFLTLLLDSTERRKAMQL